MEWAPRAMWRRGGLTWWQLLRRVGQDILADELAGRCAELAYYFLFSVFPLLLFLTTLLGYLAGISPRLRHVLFVYVSSISPSHDVTALLTTTLDQMTLSRGGAKLSLSLLAALWVASSGMLALGRTLNKANGVDETRPWWKRRLVAMALTVGISVLIAGALIVMIYGRRIGEALADEMGVASVFVAAWHVLRWPLVLAFMLLAFEAIYNFAPSRSPGARRLWGTPGAVVGVGLWVAVSIGLQLYLGEVESFALTYGSLGAVIVLLLWFYLIAFAIVVGGEVNSVLSRQIATQPQRAAQAGEPAAAAGARGRARRGSPKRQRGRTGA
jgi:membrane protein